MYDFHQEPEALRSLPAECVDFLSSNLSLSAGVSRDGGVFEVLRPWSIVHAGLHHLRKGWWKLECLGDATDTVEVRMGSSKDPYIVLRPEAVNIYLPNDAGFDIDLLISPWPGRYGFHSLKLRRLGRKELSTAVASTLVRIVRAKNKSRKLVHLFRQLRANVPLGMLSEAAKPSASARGALAANEEQQAPVSAGSFASIQAVLADGDTLLPEARQIIEREFEFSPHWRAAFCDVDDGGTIIPKPLWDDVLNRYHHLATAPFFFRSGARFSEGLDLRTRVEQLRSEFGPGSIGRIPLPLVRRVHRSRLPLDRIAVPRLPRLPTVSAIIPTKIRIDLLAKCLEGLATKTDYTNLEVIVVDNGSTDPRLPTVLGKMKERLNLISVDDITPFNFSRLVNLGAHHASGEILLLLNDDIEPEESGWLHRMVESAMDESVGAVGARLVYPDRTIQHAGVVLGIGGVCGHIWKGMSPEAAASFPYVAYPTEKLAVTGACLAVRRELYQRVGGFDVSAFPVAFNDIDFCLRVGALGYRNICRGDAVLIHHESQSRGDDAARMQTRRRLAQETKEFLARWQSRIKSDPFGSPEFDYRVESGAVHGAVLGRR